MSDSQPQAAPSKPECRVCRYIKNSIRNLVTRFYVFIFARPKMQRINDEIFQLALRSRGYNNCCDFKTTGEAIFLRRLSRHRPKLCIDVGANAGRYSEALLMQTDAQVIAFEPLAGPFQSLLALGRRYPNRLIAVNEGLADRRAELELYYGDNNTELASFSCEARQIYYVEAVNTKTVKVPVDTLDNYFHKYRTESFGEIDLLKIDTEGYEYEVLVGAQKTLRHHRPKFVQLEYNWHHLLRDHSFLRLSGLLPGYTPHQVLPHGGGLIKRDSRAPESNIFHYSNFVFVRNDISI